MKSAIVVGAGPAGLSAAEVLASAGWAVTVTEALGSPARKFLRAGVGGLNLTHSQPLEDFLSAYGIHRKQLEPFLRRFGPAELRRWAENLGVALFTGTSGRVFPVGMGALPLLDAWVTRLRTQGVMVETHTLWTGWGPQDLPQFTGPKGPFERKADALILALGGPTWPTLGTGGSWVPLLADRGVTLAPWKPANVGFTVDWSLSFRAKFEGQPVKDVVLWCPGASSWKRKGELMVTSTGLEGGLMYAAGSRLRGALEVQGTAQILLDLVPGRDRARVEAELSRPRDGRSLSTHLKKTIGLPPVKIGLLREALPPGSPDTPARVADLLKALPLALTGTEPLGKAISAAGGVTWDSLDHLQFKRIPGVWCAGEMLDWEAPTGGYLLTACFSLGRATAESVLRSSA
jgi:hypothetical protein